MSLARLPSAPDGARRGELLKERFWICDSGVGPVAIALAGTEGGGLLGSDSSGGRGTVPGFAVVALPLPVVGDMASAVRGRFGCSEGGGA